MPSTVQVERGQFGLVAAWIMRRHSDLFRIVLRDDIGDCACMPSGATSNGRETGREQPGGKSMEFLHRHTSPHLGN